MRILVTNDDGINAVGLSILEAIANELAGEDGEVWTVAPESEQSGTGHCVSFVHPFQVIQLTDRRFQTSGKPADCVLAGIHKIMTSPPDLVLAGINRGNNSGENTLYSGTIGAAMEGALQGFRSIAMSQYFSPQTQKLADPFSAARKHGLKLIKKLLNSTPWDGADYGLFLNVNFPPCEACDVKGTRVAFQGYRQGSRFMVYPHVSPSSREYLYIASGKQHSQASPGSDININLANMISVTPMRADLTDYHTLQIMADKVYE